MGRDKRGEQDWERVKRERAESEREVNCICIVVYNCVSYIYICTSGKRDWEREEIGERD